MSDKFTNLDGSEASAVAREQRPVGLPSDEPPVFERRAPSSSGRALKVWLVEELPRKLLWLAVIWLLILLHSVWPEQAEFRAEIAATQGNNGVLVADTNAPDPEMRWTAAWPNREVLASDTLRTGPDGTMDLVFRELSRVRLGPGSRVGISELRFDRDTGSRQRALAVSSGSLVVRTNVPAGPASKFIVTSGTAGLEGWNALYVVEPGRASVLEGTVTAGLNGRTATVGAGQLVNLTTLDTRPLTQAEQQALSQTALPAVGTMDRIGVVITSLELRVVLTHSTWLLNLIGHEPGMGNPFRRLGLVGSSRRAQAMKRMKDVIIGMEGQGNLPPTFSLGDFTAMGLDAETQNIVRRVFYRGQLMSYQPMPNGGYKLTAEALDYPRSTIVGLSDGTVTAERPNP